MGVELLQLVRHQIGELVKMEDFLSLKSFASNVHRLFVLRLRMFILKLLVNISL